MRPRRGGWSGWFRSRPASALRGLYFWGGVGRGKTLLMDLFHQALQGTVACERLHFHAFIQLRHASIKCTVQYCTMNNEVYIARRYCTVLYSTYYNSRTALF